MSRRVPVLVALEGVAEARVIGACGDLVAPPHRAEIRLCSLPRNRLLDVYVALHGQAWIGAYAFLTQFYLINAVLYRHDFRRWSMGVITAVGGLVHGLPSSRALWRWLHSSPTIQSPASCGTCPNSSSSSA